MLSQSTKKNKNKIKCQCEKEFHCHLFFSKCSLTPLFSFTSVTWTDHRRQQCMINCCVKTKIPHFLSGLWSGRACVSYFIHHFTVVYPCRCPHWRWVYDRTSSLTLHNAHTHTHIPAFSDGCSTAMTLAAIQIIAAVASTFTFTHVAIVTVERSSCRVSHTQWHVQTHATKL